MDIQLLSDYDFLANIGNQVGKGNQGNVHNFGKYLVVKIWKGGNDEEIADEVIIAEYAGNNGCGPIIYDFREINGVFYMVMEKVKPVKLRQTDRDEVISLFRKLIRLRIVNYDGSFGKNSKNELVIFDYGVAKITRTSAEAKRIYCKEDYFELFADFHDINIYDAFCEKN
jgi:hypothetical protein